MVHLHLVAHCDNGGNQFMVRLQKTPGEKAALAETRAAFQASVGTDLTSSGKVKKCGQITVLSRRDANPLAP